MLPWAVLGLVLVADGISRASGIQSDMPCSPPEPIEHGLADWDEEKGTAKYACFQGYHLVGPPQVECRYGTWYGDSALKCNPIVCNHPTIEHGRLETGEAVRYKSGEEANVVCDEGYDVKQASSKVICKEDGSWGAADNNEFPACKEKTCKYPDHSIPVIENGSLEINGKRQGGSKGQGGYKPGSVAVYDCHPGYDLVPLSARKRFCRRGKWEGNMPACVPQEKSPSKRTHCQAPMSITNGYYLTDRTSEAPLALPKVSEGKTQYERGTIARYKCKDGYELSNFHGQEIYRCQSNGEWTPKVPPVCISLQTSNHDDPLEQVMCPSPPAIPYADFERVEGWLTSNGAIHGTMLEYSCRVGYRDSRTPCLPTRRTCHAGKWIGRKPTCVPFDYCERPPIISHGFMTSPPENAYHVLSEVHYDCHTGYRMKGPDVLECHATGCWMPNDLPECIREDLYDSSWSTISGDANPRHVPLIAVLISISVACGFIALIATVCLIIVCRRKGGAAAQPQGPAHWSTTVTVTPECRPRDLGMGPPHLAGTNGHAHGMPRTGRAEQDRMALIAFADGAQVREKQVSLPSYEEALRDSCDPNGAPLRGHVRAHSDYDPHITTLNGPAYRYNGRTIPPHGSSAHRSSRSSRPPIQDVDFCGGTGIPFNRLQQQQQHSLDNADALSHHSVTQWQGRQGPGHRRRGHRSGSSAAGHSGAEPDALSDSMSHNSIQVWPCRQQSSQSTSLRSSSGSNGSNCADLNVDPSPHSALCSNPMNAAATNAEVTSQTTVVTEASGNSQTPSCRALAGSLASFDTSSAINTEGVPLLEEHEVETEGSNTSSVSGETGSATYSEGSSKN